MTAGGAGLLTVSQKRRHGRSESSARDFWEVVDATIGKRE